jgi:hypothetical protein
MDNHLYTLIICGGIGLSLILLHRAWMLEGRIASSKELHTVYKVTLVLMYCTMLWTIEFTTWPLLVSLVSLIAIILMEIHIIRRLIRVTKHNPLD